MRSILTRGHSTRTKASHNQFSCYKEMFSINLLLAFFHLLPKPRPYFFVRLIDGSTENRIHVSSVVPLLRESRTLS